MNWIFGSSFAINLYFMELCSIKMPCEILPKSLLRFSLKANSVQFFGGFYVYSLLVDTKFSIKSFKFSQPSFFGRSI